MPLEEGGEEIKNSINFQKMNNLTTQTYYFMAVEKFPFVLPTSLYKCFNSYANENI